MLIAEGFSGELTMPDDQKIHPALATAAWRGTKEDYELSSIISRRSSGALPIACWPALKAAQAQLSGELVNRLTHSLQTATGLRRWRDEEYVVAALLTISATWWRR